MFEKRPFSIRIYFSKLYMNILYRNVFSSKWFFPWSNLDWHDFMFYICRMQFLRNLKVIARSTMDIHQVSVIYCTLVARAYFEIQGHDQYMVTESSSITLRASPRLPSEKGVDTRHGRIYWPSEGVNKNKTRSVEEKVEVIAVWQYFSLHCV